MSALEWDLWSNTDPSSFQEQNGSDQGSLNRNCSPWTLATHPEGAPYFFDRERVRASVTLKDTSHDEYAMKEVVHRYGHARSRITG
jgi:hypothetical protein